jgi:ABC-type dipeptide/oligopeptide/nickel transport system permease subunit
MAVASPSAKPIVLSKEDEKTRSYWADTWYEFSRNRPAVVGLIVVILLVLLALTAPFWKSLGIIEDPAIQHSGTARAYPMTCAVDNKPGDPQWCYVFGSDQHGRDTFSRAIYGTQVSLAVGAIGMVITMTVGILYGIVAGYFGGRVDMAMMRIVDVMYGLPELVLIILFQVFFKSVATSAQSPEYRNAIGPIGIFFVELDSKMGGLFFVFVVIGLLSWIGVARQTRAQVLSYKNKEFVEAARAVGARHRRIIFVHLLPNIVGPLLVIAALAVPGFIFTEAALSFLGLGANAPTPSWGSMLNFARDQGFASHPWWVLAPGGMLAITTLAFTFIGDGLRDAFDPRIRGN